MVVKEHLVTVDEFDAFMERPENRDRRFELINGVITEKGMTTEEHGEVTANIITALVLYNRTAKLGRVGPEITHRRPEDKLNSREPDVSFTVGKRPSVTQGAVMQMPDLAVEVKSPSNTFKELRDKAHFYLLNGTRMVWIVHPTKKLVYVLTPDSDEEVYLEHETISGGDVLPGFTIAVKDIFADPLAE